MAAFAFFESRRLLSFSFFSWGDGVYCFSALRYAFTFVLLVLVGSVLIGLSLIWRKENVLVHAFVYQACIIYFYADQMVGLIYPFFL